MLPLIEFQFPVISKLILKQPELRKLERHCAAAAVTANGIIVRAVAYAKQENGESEERESQREREREIKEKERETQK